MNKAEQKAIAKIAKDKLDALNVERANIAEFLEKRKLQAETIETDKATRKAKRRTSGVKKLGKENFILLQIYNASEQGITFEKLVSLGSSRVDPITGESKWKSPTTQKHVTSAVSEITINHNWNVNETTTQRGELKLRDPQKLDKASTRKSIGDVYFTSVNTGEVASTNVHKNNNLITLVIGQEAVKTHLLSNGATLESFNL